MFYITAYFKKTLAKTDIDLDIVTICYTLSFRKNFVFLAASMEIFQILLLYRYQFIKSIIPNQMHYVKYFRFNLC